MKYLTPTVSGPTVPPPSPHTRRVSRTSSSLTQASRSSIGKGAQRLFRLIRVPLAPDPGALQLSLPEIDRNCLYRKGEIIWLILDKPLLLDCAAGPADGFIIRFWPSIIEMVENDGNPLGVPHGQEIPTSTFLRVRLFSSGIVYDVPQHCTLPFPAYVPDGLWLQRLRLQSSDPLPGSQNPFTGFIRISDNLSDDKSTLTLSPEELLPHFLSDVDISLEIARFWSTSSTTSSLQSAGEPTTIQPHTSAIRAHCRELWWGAERITVGDLVRLRILESTLCKVGVDQTWFIPRPLPGPPMEATPVTRLELEDAQLFFKLRSLAISETGIGKELRAFGGLYRLVPHGPGLPPPLDADTDHGHPALPRSPEGLAFRSVLGSGWEIELSLHHFDGRYYPQIQELLTGPSGVNAHVLEVLEGVACWETPQSRPTYNKRGPRKEIVAQMIGTLRKV